jgi:hypothetical protein
MAGYTLSSHVEKEELGRRFFFLSQWQIRPFQQKNSVGAVLEHLEKRFFFHTLTRGAYPNKKLGHYNYFFSGGSVLNDPK